MPHRLQVMIDHKYKNVIFTLIYWLKLTRF